MSRTLIYRTCPASSSEMGKAVYWDHSIREQVVSPIHYGGTCTRYSIGENVLLDAWCEGSTRKEVRAVWDGNGRPPLVAYRVTSIENSEHCAISNPCGLSVLDVQVVETARNVFRATVIASHSEGLEFSLNNWVDAQESNVFEGLAPGAYNVRVRAKKR